MAQIASCASRSAGFPEADVNIAAIAVVDAQETEERLKLEPNSSPKPLSKEEQTLPLEIYGVRLSISLDTLGPTRVGPERSCIK